MLVYKGLVLTSEGPENIIIIIILTYPTIEEGGGARLPGPPVGEGGGPLILHLNVLLAVVDAAAWIPGA